MQEEEEEEEEGGEEEAEEPAVTEFHGIRTSIMNPEFKSSELLRRGTVDPRALWGLRDLQAHEFESWPRFECR
ncbi:hypothetical protein E2C01_059797 [Portunus trituberculatus]|uniref:Uncharacterized protein n=1 Tax=Portunus trituberculatus TaxID=210409 RepID=A0A5B7H777_PORTR|nr:hypothetical protein [Portunus trituberculatus]